MKIVHTFVLFLFLYQNLAFGVEKPEEPTGIDSQFSTPTNLTDQQMENARTFVHQGQRDRIYEEGCKNIDNCKFEEGFPIEMMIGKAYGLIGMFTGDGMSPNLKMKPTQAQIDAANATNTANAAKTPPVTEKVEPEQDKRKDYCMMAAMVWEGVASIFQQQLQKKADNTTTPGDAQLQALVSLKQTHEARKETATYQAAVYGGVSLCYIGMMLSGVDLSDPMLWVKFGGAAALTTLYGLKAKKHSDAAEDVQVVIDSMDWAGKNCNPWTRTKCFCSEPTSKTIYPSQYQEVCILNNGNFETPKVALGCASVTGAEVKYDKECKCKQNNSCLKTGIKLSSNQVGTGINYINEANKTFEMLSSGQYDRGELERATLRASQAARQVKMKSLNKLPTPPLNPEQQKVAKAMEQFLPEKLAQLSAASQPKSLSKINEPNFRSASLSKLSPKLRQQLAKSISAGYLQKDGGTSSKSDEPDFVMPSFGSKNSEASGGTETMDFAEKAQMKAEITNQPSTPIFEIISNRYQRSGWQKLDTQGY